MCYLDPGIDSGKCYLYGTGGRGRGSTKEPMEAGESGVRYDAEKH